MYNARHASSAHAQNESTIAVWLARLVASVNVSLGILSSFDFLSLVYSFGFNIHLQVELILISDSRDCG